MYVDPTTTPQIGQRVAITAWLIKCAYCRYSDSESPSVSGFCSCARFESAIINYFIMRDEMEDGAVVGLVVLG